MTTVLIEDSSRMNLLGLILGTVLERQLDDSSRARWVRGLAGEVVVHSNGMTVTMAFESGQPVRLRREAPRRPKATLEAPLDVLADLALGRHLVSHVARRRFHLRGSLTTLLRVWCLLRISPGSVPPLEEQT